MVFRPMLLCGVLTLGCLPVWKPAGLYSCLDGGCPVGHECDDGVCCVPGQTPACPTLPFAGRCEDGGAPTAYFRDSDNDGFGDGTSSGLFCARPSRSRWAREAGDCRDDVSAINPGQTDACNGVDDDCDGVIDNDRAGINRRTAWFIDADGDRFGAGDASVLACAAPPGSGLASVGGDCNDSVAAIRPFARELCNGADENCNGLIDEGPFSDDIYWPGELPLNLDKAACDAGAGCQPANVRCVGATKICVPRVALAPERCDGIDNDCNGRIDERPGCGGPERLAFSEGTVSASTVRLPPFSALYGRCIGSAGEMPRSAVWAPPLWVTSMDLETNANATAGFVHVWRLTASPGQTWDLRGNGITLALPLQFSDFVAAPDDAGLWFDAQRLQQPLINLCDENNQLVRQLRPTVVHLPEASGRGLWLAGESLPLNQPADGGWSVTSGLGSLGGVKSFELVISNRALTTPTAANLSFITVRVNLLDAGFRGGP